MNLKDRKFRKVIVVTDAYALQFKQQIYESKNIVIWDIKNLLFLCNGKKNLIDLLYNGIMFSVDNTEQENPIEFAEKPRSDVIAIEKEDTLLNSYKEKLSTCKTGKENSAYKKYEDLCLEIIRYLFRQEFLRFEPQYETEDGMFRIDLMCSLKGTTEFWKFLIRFYNTKFVVFEFKNYEDKIGQNLIYTTEKYLYPIALRNIAIIISRKGFDKNAKKAAIGSLRENGKLILDITDEDLIEMIKMKENGEEPSDYLLDKTERLLMSVSK